LSQFEFDSQNGIYEESVSYKKRCLRQYSFIKNTIGTINSLFEVGSASGFNLSLYHKEGVNVYGIEPSENNVSSCEKKYGIEMFHGVFQEYMSTVSKTSKYELIFLSHVLEHIINPYDFLRKLSDINQQYMFIEVPSLDYKFCDEPFGMFAEDHVNYFTFDNLRYLMGNLGYHVVDANLYFALDLDIPAGYPCLSTIWEKNSAKIQPHSLASSRMPIESSRGLLMKYLKQSEKLTERVNKIIDKIDDKVRLGVWGTGHHTSRLLGNSSLKRKNIIKFYDSDIRKKDMSYFNKSISSFNPDDIINEKIDSVLISTYVAQQKVLNVLRKNDIDCNYIMLY
jgi:hypothetical protein